MKIGLISQWFPPEHGSAALPGTIAEALTQAGHQVEVVTGFPNYPQGELQEGWRQTWNHTELRNGVTVHRTPIFISHDHRAWRRMLNYLSFALSATVTTLRRLRRVDVVWVHGTPALPALPAMVLRRLSGTRYVLHIQDLWPDTVLASGMLPRRLEPLVRKPLEWFCMRSYHLASAVAIITPGMRGALVERGVPNAKIIDLPNWADERIFRPLPDEAADRAGLGLPDGFLAMYAGAMGDVQGLETVLRAASLLKEEPDINIALVGDGVARDRLVALAKSLKLDKVTFVESQPLNRMSSVLACADVQIICLKDLPLYRMTLPSKVQATLAAGQPIVLSASGDAGVLVQAAGAGLSCPAGDAQALSAALRMACQLSPSERSQWGENGLHYYQQHLSQAVGIERMVAALDSAQRLGRGRA